MAPERKIERTIDIYVRDRNGHRIPGATIKFKTNGKDSGEVNDSEGSGRIELEKRDTAVDVEALYHGERQAAKLAVNQDFYVFTFDVDVNPNWRGLMERHLPLIVGLLLFAVAIVLAFTFGAPTPLQSRIILGVFSLGGGAIATEIGGLIKVDLNLGQKLVVGATGAIAIFVILYLVLPA
jgi:hypothetical protein